MHSSLAVFVADSTFRALGSRSVVVASVSGRSARRFDVSLSLGFGASSIRCRAWGLGLNLRLPVEHPAVGKASFGFGSAQHSALGCRPRGVCVSRPSWSSAVGVLPAFPGRRLAAPFSAVQANPAYMDSPQKQAD